METPFTNCNVLPLRHNELYDFFAKFIIITAELVNLTRVFLQEHYMEYCRKEARVINRPQKLISKGKTSC